MDAIVSRPRGPRILWLNVLTVVSAAILIGAEVFGAAFAAGWALESLTGLGHRIAGIVHAVLSLFSLDFDIPAQTGVLVLQAIFFVCGVAVMVRFLRNARHVEPFTARD